jgi:hypothetical protein
MYLLRLCQIFPAISVVLCCCRLSLLFLKLQSTVNPTNDLEFAMELFTRTNFVLADIFHHLFLRKIFIFQVDHLTEMEILWYLQAPSNIMGLPLKPCTI